MTTCHPFSTLPTLPTLPTLSTLPTLPALPTLQDSTGCSALHVSISCKQPQCSGILLSHPNIDLTQQDKSGNTPFAAALAARDHQAGLAILKRELKAAEQVKSHSRTCSYAINKKYTIVRLLLACTVDWGIFV